MSNFAYTRWNLIHPEIAEKQQAFEDEFVALTPIIDQQAKTLYEKNPVLAVNYLTDYSTGTGDRVTHEWKYFYNYLFMKYMDGNVKTPNPGYQNPHVKQPGYGENWYKKIVKETGDQFKVIGDGH